MGDFERKRRESEARSYSSTTRDPAVPGKNTGVPTGLDGATSWDGKPYKNSVFSGAGVPWSAQSSGTRDSKLVIETPVIAFPKTVVGASSLRSVTLRNDDVRAIALDDVAPLELDPFAEFRVIHNSTVVLQPGERRDVSFEFHPARAARTEQRFQLVVTPGPPTAAVDIRVSGEGVDVPYTVKPEDGERNAAVSSPQATMVRIEEQQRDRFAAVRGPDPLHDKRADAFMQLEKWQLRALEFNDSVAHWTLRNWQTFVGKTGGNTELHGTAQVIDLWKRGVYAGLKKGAGAGVNTALEMAKKSAKAVLFLEYPLFGLAIGQAVDHLSDFLLDKLGVKPQKPEEESDSHALAATESVAHASVRNTDEVFQYKAGADLLIRDTASAAELQISRSASGEELALWRQWARAGAQNLILKDRTDLHFSNVLLNQWVLEHAGTSKAANKDTNPAAWTAARDELKREGRLKSLERTDLFIHQCRHEWGVLGLAETEQVSAMLDTERRALEEQARAWGIEDAAIPSMLAGQLSKQVTFQRSFEPSLTATHLGKLQYQLGPDPDLMGRRVFGDEFVLDCSLTLVPDGKGVAVKRFTYDVRSAHVRGGFSGLIRTPMKSATP